jgi:hypothetical protein
LRFPLFRCFTASRIRYLLMGWRAAAPPVVGSSTWAIAEVLFLHTFATLRQGPEVTDDAAREAVTVGLKCR